MLFFRICHNGGYMGMCAQSNCTELNLKNNSPDNGARAKHLNIMTGIELIAKERQEQIEKHGYTPQSDVRENKFAQLIDAAIMILQTDRRKMNPPSLWDKQIWERMINKGYKERLIISAALIAAELDRMECAGEDE